MSEDDATLAGASITWTPATPTGPTGPVADTPPQLPERYEDLGLIARGGQGEVRRVWDHKLERELAVKVLTRPSGDAWRRFRLESNITIDLAHPGIIPVHDRGTTDDGRPWFAMKPVQGVDLSAAIQAGHDDPPDPRWPRRRLLDVFARICETIAFAHRRGVVHRDLKPGNVMVGEFGEVWVVDWGLARRLDEVEPEATDEVDDDPTLRDPSISTRIGAVLGTPGYMPPEQADGHASRADRRSDVYALGGLLYAILTGRRPDGPPDDLDAPAPLVELVRAAMQPDPDDRPPDADALRRAVADWFDGARRRAEALELVDHARALLPTMAEHRAAADRLDAEAAALLDPIPAHAPEEKKHPGWRLQDDAIARRREATMTALRFEQTLRAALLRSPELPEADRLLADHYRAGLQRAEAVRDEETIARMATLLAAHDDGRHAAFLSGRARLTLLTDAPDARITLYRYLEKDRMRVIEPTGRVFEGPIEGVELDPGSYLAVIEADGRHPVQYPVFIERGRDWHGIPPGETAPRPIALPQLGELGPEDRYVPAGWCLVGGDARAVDPVPRQWLWVDGFICRRFPVTHGEYRDGLSRGDVDRVPARRSTAGELDPVYRWQDGRWHLGATDQGVAIEADWPVSLVDWWGAMAHAKTVPGGWRLPDSLEWEKAARGVDGRWWPWGDAYDASRACTLESFAGPPGPRPVGHAAADESPYGVRDLVGGVRQWCLGTYRRGGPDGARLVVTVPSGDGLREGRGGAWSTRAEMVRPAGRFAGPPHVRSWLVGFRLVRPFG